MLSHSRHGAGFALAALLCNAPGMAESPSREPVAVTLHFAFFSDLETNLHDRLIAAGAARRQGKPELFGSDTEAACLEKLPSAERTAWNLAVDYYAEIISPLEFYDREQMVPRLELAGIVADNEWDDPEERDLVRMARGFREAAAPAYETCIWPTRDQANRRWIVGVTELMAEHEEALAARLEKVYQTPWPDLPIPVDIVETANWAGANTLNLVPTGCHIMVSSSNPRYQDRAALEMVFHEAAHFPTGRRTSLSAAEQRCLASLSPRRRMELRLESVLEEVVRSTH